MITLKKLEINFQWMDEQKILIIYKLIIQWLKA